MDDQHRSFVTAMAIDSVAAGVFQPATILFLLATTQLGLPTIGTAMTVAGLLAYTATGGPKPHESVPSGSGHRAAPDLSTRGDLCGLQKH